MCLLFSYVLVSEMWKKLCGSGILRVLCCVSVTHRALTNLIFFSCRHFLKNQVQYTFFFVVCYVGNKFARFLGCGYVVSVSFWSHFSFFDYIMMDEKLTTSSCRNWQSLVLIIYFMHGSLRMNGRCAQELFMSFGHYFLA